MFPPSAILVEWRYQSILEKIDHPFLLGEGKGLGMEEVK